MKKYAVNGELWGPQLGKTSAREWLLSFPWECAPEDTNPGSLFHRREYEPHNTLRSSNEQLFSSYRSTTGWHRNHSRGDEPKKVSVSHRNMVASGINFH